MNAHKPTKYWVLIMVAPYYKVDCFNTVTSNVNILHNAKPLFSSPYRKLCKAKTMGVFNAKSNGFSKILVWLMYNWQMQNAAARVRLWIQWQLPTLFSVVQELYLRLCWKSHWWYVFDARCKEQHICQSQVNLTSWKNTQQTMRCTAQENDRSVRQELQNTCIFSDLLNCKQVTPPCTDFVLLIGSKDAMDSRMRQYNTTVEKENINCSHSLLCPDAQPAHRLCPRCSRATNSWPDFLLNVCWCQLRNMPG